MEEIAVYSGFTLAEILNIKKAWNRKNKQRAQIKIPQIR